MVQVQAQQGPLQTGAGAGGKRLLQPVHHQAAVGQVRERVVEGQVLNLARGGCALGDIAQRGHVMGQRAVAVRHGSDGHEMQVHLAALAAVPQLALPLARAGQAGPHGIKKGFVVVARGQQAGGLAHHLVGAVAGDAAEGAVGAQDAGVGIGDDHALLGLERDGGNAQLVLVALAGRNVLAHAPVATKHAVCIEHRRAADGHPVRVALPVVALELEVAELLVALQQCAVLLPLRIAHAWRGQLPARLAHVQRCLLHQPVIGAAFQMREAKLRILLPVPVGRQRREGAKTRLVVLQLAAHAVGLAHVAEHQHHAHDLPLGVADGGSAVGDLVFGPVAREQGGVVAQRHHLALVHHLLHRVHLGFARAGVDDAEHIGQWLPQGLRQRPAGQALGHRVHAGDAALRIGGHHGVANGMQGDGQVLLALAQPGLGVLAGQCHAVEAAAQLGQLLQPRGGRARHIAPLGQLVGGVQQALQGPRHPPPHAHLGHHHRHQQPGQQEGHLGPHALVGGGIQVLQRHREAHGGHGFAARLNERLEHHQLGGAVGTRAQALPLRGLQHHRAELAIGKRGAQLAGFGRVAGQHAAIGVRHAGHRAVGQAQVGQPQAPPLQRHHGHGGAHHVLRAPRDHRVGKVDAGHLGRAVHLKAAHGKVAAGDGLLKIRAVGHIDRRLQRAGIAQQIAVRTRHADVHVGGVE